MKLMKKLMVVFVAVLMVMTMTNKVFADATITVTNTQPTTDENATIEVYTAYRVFDAAKADGTTITTSGTTQTASGGISYSIKSNSPWFSVLFDANGAPVTGQKWVTATKIDGTSNPVVYQILAVDTVLKDEASAKEFAAWLFSKLPTTWPDGYKYTLAAGETTVADGYYLITSSLGAALGLATADFPMTIIEKNAFPSLDKKQIDTANGTYADADLDVGVNDTIYYQISVFVPATADKDLTVVDTPANSLTIPETLTVTAKAGDTTLNSGTDYTFTQSTMTFVIKPTTNTLGKTVTFEFALTVNANAITKVYQEASGTGDDATPANKENKNTAVLTYSNYKQTDEVYFRTYAAGFEKVDKDNHQTKLTGAEFILLNGTTEVPVAYDSTGNYYYPTTGTGVKIAVDANGQFVIRGLDNLTTYKVKETKAPEGYKLPANPFDVTVTADDAAAFTVGETTKIVLENTAGTVLPSTGGIGTTIFHVAGAALVLGAGIILVSKKRMNNN